MIVDTVVGAPQLEEGAALGRTTDGPTGQSTGEPRRGPAIWLLLVAAAYVAAMFVAVVPRSALGWDESLYVSQVDPHTPAGYFSAPRARGVSFLVAPVLRVTDSVPVLRAYLAVLAGVLLIAAFWPWLRAVRRPWLVPLAALLFSGLWVVLFYGASVMPNPWVGFGCLAAVGWFVRYGSDARHGNRAADSSGAQDGNGAARWAPVGVAAGLAFATLMRPTDAFWVSVPLGIIMLAVRRWRRPALWLAVVVGDALGFVPWLVESYLRFGGPTARLHRASGVEGGLSWHPLAALYEMRAVNGPLLCRPCDTHVTHPLLIIWWLAIPGFVIAGLLAAARSRQLAALAIPAACGATLAASYLLTVPYAAPRFLIPAYTLLALPIAGFLTWLIDALPRRLRVPAVGLLALLLAVHLGLQAAVLIHQVDQHTGKALGYPPAAAALERLGVDKPCVIVGKDAVPIAYDMGCESAAVIGNNKTTTDAGVLSMSHHARAAYVTHHAKPPKYLASWRRHKLPTAPGEHQWYAFTPPWRVTV
jgi:hypothetical protein